MADHHCVYTGILRFSNFLPKSQNESLPGAICQTVRCEPPFDSSLCFGKHKYMLCEYAIIEHEKPVEESGFFPAISCRLMLFFCCFRLPLFLSVFHKLLLTFLHSFQCTYLPLLMHQSEILPVKNQGWCLSILCRYIFPVLPRQRLRYRPFLPVMLSC